jgi:hypothetical protein
MMTDPDEVDFDDIRTSKQDLDDARSRASYLTLGSKYTKMSKPNQLHTLLASGSA